MLRKTILAVVLIIATAPISRADKKIAFSLSPSLVKTYGETEYIMDIVGPLDDGTGVLRTATIKSHLVFPLDVTMIGLAAGLNEIADPNRWSVEASFQTSISDPSGLMTDDDWDGLEGVYDVTHFSSTESRAEISSIIVSLEATYRILDRYPFTLSVLAGGRYQKIQQDIIGYDGWQRDYNVLSEEYEGPAAILGNGLAMTYEITFKQPLVGLVARLQPQPDLALDLKAAYAPVFYDDEDDHVLRGKISLSDGDGHGALAGFNLHYGQTRTYGAAPFWDITSELVYINANGGQTQEWYVDELAGDGSVLVEAGTVLIGIPHEINSTQYNVGVKVGVKF